MARPLRVVFADAFYPVTWRGSERKAIYRDHTDRAEWLPNVNQELSLVRDTNHRPSYSAK